MDELAAQFAPVTAIVPVYNAAPYLRRALASVAAQTTPPEVVALVDDGSTDNSAEIARAAEAELLAPRGIAVLHLRTNRAGGAGARNAGLAAAPTPRVAMLDADDAWYADHLERATALMDEAGAVAFVGGVAYHHVDGSHTPPRLAYGLAEPRADLTFDDFWSLWMGRGQFFPHTTVVYDAARVRAVGGFDTAFRRRHDLELWMRVVHGNRWAVDPQPHATYQADTPGSLSRNVAEASRLLLRVVEKNRGLLGDAAARHALRFCARRAMTSALTDGDAVDRRAARASTWRYLWPRDRLLLGAASAVPWAFGAANRSRRRRRGL